MSSRKRTTRQKDKVTSGDVINTKLMLKRHCTRKKMQPTAIFISQEYFNRVIREGTIEEAFTVIERYPEMVIGIDVNGYCPLMCVADRRFKWPEEAVALVDKLILVGAKMHSGCFFSVTPLYYAANKSALALQALVRHESHWENYLTSIVTPWRVALYSSATNFEIILPFIPAAAALFRNFLGQSLLIEVVAQCPSVTIKALAHLHFRELINVPDDNGETPLAHAARLTYSREEAVQALLACGADLLYAKNGRSFYYSDVNNQRGSVPRSSAAINYIRQRIAVSFDHAPFENRYATWYK